jgi:hypothetical protein
MSMTGTHYSGAAAIIFCREEGVQNGLFAQKSSFISAAECRQDFASASSSCHPLVLPETKGSKACQSPAVG